MVDKYRDFASNLLQSKIICPTQMIYKRARKHVLWRKENREELFVSRMIIRTSVVALILALVSVIAMPSPSGAYTDTWNQTNWNGGVGTSSATQYSSALGINENTAGQFALQNLNRTTNGNFDSNLNSWTTGTSEITPQVVSTSIKGAVSATSHTLPYLSTPQEGNLLVATIGFNSNPGTVGVPAGWTLAVDSRINNSAILGRVAIYYKAVQAGDPTSFVVTNSTSAAVNFNIQELTGVDLINPVDTFSKINSGLASTTTSVIPATSTTTRASSIAVAGAVYVSASAFSSWSNGFTNASGVNTYGYSATKVLSTKQTVNTTFTGVTARQNAGALVVFRGALASQQNDVIPGIVQSRAYTTELVHTIALPADPQVGNILVAAISTTSNPGSILLPTGWVQAVGTNNTSSLARAEIYYKIVEAGDSRSLAVETTVGTVSTFTLHEFSGIDTSNPVDVTSIVNSAAATSTAVNIPATPTTSAANGLAIARAAYDNSNVYGSWTNSFSNVSATTTYGYTATKLISSPQAVSTTFTAVTARRNQGALAVFNAAPLQTPTTVQEIDYRYSTSPAITARYVDPISKGNTLFVTFNSRANAGTITPPAGWTEVASSESASGRGTYLYSKVAGENESPNFRFDSLYGLSGTISIYEVRGILTDSPFDQKTTFANVSTNPLALSLPASSQNQAFILGAIGSSTTSGFPVSWLANGFSTTRGSLTSEFQSGHLFQSTAVPYNISFTNASLRILQGFLVSFKSGGSYVDATRNTATKYAGASSARIYASPWANARFTQSIDATDTETYEITTYIYNDGDVVDATVASLYYNDDIIATDYTSMGAGWYKLSTEITGEATARDVGVEVVKDNSVYVDEFGFSRFSDTGTLTSNVFDTGQLSNWGNVNFTTSGLGAVAVKARSSNNSSMSGAPNFSTCSAIVSGADISTGTNGCVTDAERYIQYQVILTRGTGTSPIFEDIAIDYVGADQIAPDTNASNIAMFKSNGGDSVAQNGWTNGNVPYFSWDQGLDNAGGIGVAGYCVYLGTDNSADPITTKGMLGTGDLNVRGTCPFATANEYLDGAAVGVLASQLATSNSAYYLNLKAIDGNGNVFTGSSASFHFRFDNTAPENPDFVNAPSNFISTKTATFSWPTSTGSAPGDSNSGVAGLQYRIGLTGTWYGDNHTGTQDFSDLLANYGEYTTQNVPYFEDLI